MTLSGGGARHVKFVALARANTDDGEAVLLAWHQHWALADAEDYRSRLIEIVRSRGWHVSTRTARARARDGRPLTTTGRRGHDVHA